MTRAGFGKVEISSAVVGAELVGYGNRDRLAHSVHDPLFARALVLESGTERVAICSLDLCLINEDIVSAARERIADPVRIPPENVFVSATHTHSGPMDDDRSCWPDGLHAKIAEAVAEACERLRPAVIGAGWGMLHAHSFNRRRFEDPVDPAVIVIRVDDVQGNPLGLYYGFGCHPVVLGPDSREASGDFAGICSLALESRLGTDVVAVFGQGACADVNPLTTGVHEHLAQGCKVYSKLEWLSYYGPDPAPEGSTDIGDRNGGTFPEAQAIGSALTDEVLRVHRGIECQAVSGLWTHRKLVGSPTLAPANEFDHPIAGVLDPRIAPDQPLEITVLGIDGPDVVLVGQPGEVFAETGIRMRRELRLAGVTYPFVVGYANGWRAYLPPDHAIPDGGYEVGWAQMLGMPERLQDQIRAAVLDAVVRQRDTTRAVL